MITNKLDHILFSKFHLVIIASLGVSWLIDGYEVTLVSVLAIGIKDKFNINNSEIGVIGSIYLLGAVVGSVLFAYKSGNYGRKKLFMTTLIIYMISILITTFSNNFLLFLFGRFLTGLSVGGEYSSIFASIDELIPAKYRGRVNILVDGTWHIGSCMSSIIGALGFEYSVGNMRILFMIGFIFAFPIIFLRQNIPESPRWLFAKGRITEAEIIINEIEEKAKIDFDIFYLLKFGFISNINMLREIKLKELVSHINIFSASKINNIDKTRLNNTNIENEDSKFTFSKFFSLFKTKYKNRFYLGLILMTSQAYFFNGIFYTFTISIKTFYNIEYNHIGLYLIPLSIANILGVIMFGRFFDSWSRKKMISLCYFMSGFLLIITSFLFYFNDIHIKTLMIFWFSVFIFASPSGSSAHLVVSESFPIYVRSQAMAFFFAFGYLFGGACAPFIFGVIVNTESRFSVTCSYISAGIVMIIASIINYNIGVDSEGKTLEEINFNNEI